MARRVPRTPADDEAERERARLWWRRLPLEHRPEIARDMGQNDVEFPWGCWFLSRPHGPFLDELHRMAALLEEDDPAALELEHSPLHPPELAEEAREPEPAEAEPLRQPPRQLGLAW